MFWWNWRWDEWGQGFAVTLGVLVGLAIFLVPAFLFLLNLRDLLAQVRERDRAMEPAQVWLNLIPLFGIGWFIFTVIKVRESLQAEYRSRGWASADDLGYSVGLTAGIAAAAMVVLGWIPFFGWLIGLTALVTWILYWVKTAGLRAHLAQASSADGPTRVWAPRWDQGPTPPHGTVSTPPGPEGTERDGGDEGPVSTQARGAESGSGDQCPVCGARTEHGDRFCRSCGQRLQA